jgi:chromate transporter
MALPFIWVLALFIVFNDFSSNPMVNAVVTGVGAAGAGLFIGTAVKLGKVLARKPAALTLITICFLLTAVARVSLLYVIPVGFLVALYAARKDWL